MVAYLVAAVVSLLVSITGTPLLIRVLHKKQYGQFIRQDGPTSHHGWPGDDYRHGAGLLGR